MVGLAFISLMKLVYLPNNNLAKHIAVVKNKIIYLCLKGRSGKTRYLLSYTKCNIK